MTNEAIKTTPVEELKVRGARFLAAMHERRAKLQKALEPIVAASKELVGEFGCGHGHFLVAYAEAHPADVCIGVDLDSNRIERACRKQARAKARHLYFLQADATLFLEMLPARASFSRVFILFPDPWPKKRHHKNRLIQSQFLDAVQRHANDRTRIYFRTDHEPYFEQAQRVFAQHTGWQLIDEPWPFEHQTVFQSRAESFCSLVAQPRKIAS